MMPGMDQVKKQASNASALLACKLAETVGFEPTSP